MRLQLSLRSFSRARKRAAANTDPHEIGTSALAPAAPGGLPSPQGAKAKAADVDWATFLSSLFMERHE
jgi:hypothetical protein